MAKTFQFDNFDGSRKAKEPHCSACEGMLADALDESLDEQDQAWFAWHISTCAECSMMLADAQRGAAWLELLKTPRPEPSTRLMERILAQTSGVNGLPDPEIESRTVYQPPMVPMAPLMTPTALPGDLLEFRPRLPRIASWSSARGSSAIFEPRLAMTAAMAFFSIALTLNLTGVQLNRLHVKALTPASLKHTYYEANAQATRYYDNLRVVRVLESRVEDLREAVADDSRKTQRAQPQIQPQVKPGMRPETPGAGTEEKKKPEGGPGLSRRDGPMARPQFLMTEEKTRRNEKPVTSVERKHEEGGLV